MVLVVVFFLTARVCFWSQLQIQVKLDQQRNMHTMSLPFTSLPSYVSGRTGLVGRRGEQDLILITDVLVSLCQRSWPMNVVNSCKGYLKITCRWWKVFCCLVIHATVFFWSVFSTYLVLGMMSRAPQIFCKLLNNVFLFSQWS